MRRAALAAVLICLAVAPAARAAWLAGDLHVHTCFSHDVFCGPLDQPFQIEPGDDPAEFAAEEVQYLTDPENLQQLYAYGMTVGERFAEASLRGLDYLAITDHNDMRSVAAPGFGGAGVIGVPGYEDSVRGHAQVLGAGRVLDNGDGSAAALRALADELHGLGGVLQANHPGYTTDGPFASCNQDPGSLHWTYGYDVSVDSIEVWNPTASVSDAEAYLECWLQRGARVAATGGGDSHWASTVAAQGVGNPTTWVLADSRSAAGILAAIRAGRTSISRLAPAQGGAPLLLEVRDADGSWANAIGEDVAPGAAMRVRSQSAPASGLVTVRANGLDLVHEAVLRPGGAIVFSAPATGWMRARLHAVGSAAAGLPGCAHELGGNEKASTCAYDHTLLGMTSPAYVHG
ncbi:MAG: CehA/McbA family metallohydrolase [Solirubrobacteraceae bacterium]